MPDSSVLDLSMSAWLFCVQNPARTFAAAAWLMAGGSLAGDGLAVPDGLGLAVPGEVLAVADGWVTGPADGVYWLVAAGLSAGVNRIVFFEEMAAIPVPKAAP